jgi:hypothetical protein
VIFSEHHEVVQALLLDALHPALRASIQVRRPRSQNKLTEAVAEYKERYTRRGPPESA